MEDEEECRVTNIDEETRLVGDLWRCVRDANEGNKEEDDGFGPKKPAVDPDDPVARKFLLLSVMMMLLLDVPKEARC